MSIVKDFIADLWESKKPRLYGDNVCPDPQLNSSRWDFGQDGKLWNGRNGRSGKLSHSNDVIGACISSKKCVAGVRCATKSRDPSHYVTPLYDVYNCSLVMKSTFMYSWATEPSVLVV